MFLSDRFEFLLGFGSRREPISSLWAHPALTTLNGDIGVMATVQAALEVDGGRLTSSWSLLMKQKEIFAKGACVRRKMMEGG